jgi:D-threo-aldose 1-dehydrogenase
MEQIALAQTGRTTTRLGFGSSSVMGALNRRESLAMLEAAVDAGITHFDTAPSYGYGQAESVLGELLARHPGKLTITTKYGIAPAKNPGFISLARNLVRPLLKTIPGLKKRLAGVASSVVRREPDPTFTVAEARASLERSLGELRTSRIDVWLLHEASASSLKDEALLRFMEDQLKQGTIGSFGIGSGFQKIPTLLAERPAFCPVLQYEWSVLDAAIPASASFRIHHRSLTENFRTLHAALIASPGTCQRWSDATGHDLAHSEFLANLMLKASLVANPESIILFSSKSKHHIANNVAVADNTGLVAPAQRLHELVRAEHETLLHPAVT